MVQVDAYARCRITASSRATATVAFRYLWCREPELVRWEGQWRYWLLPSAQLLRFSLLSTLEIIVGLHKEKPSILPIADRTCLL